ncbi:hypothetical protein [Halorarius halobius]|uniref:hypothetical protein n=1 Tax=Halorarius halobius TaxID=2962671 RepID=UPI0020CF9C08|nr:hypothetical protein [Halorarius halobius]
MPSKIRSRLVVLACLAVVGVVLAGVGTALSTTSPLTDGDPSARFVVADGNVTFSDDDGNVTLVDDASHIRTVRIRRTDGGTFRVDTETDRPLTAVERERAVEIARANDSITRRLDALDGYTLTVGPVHQPVTMQLDDVRFDNSTQTDVGRVETSVTETDNGVVVHRNDSSTYVDDRAVVFVTRPDSSDLKYAIEVDLANGTVTSISDQEPLRRRK